MGRKRRIHIEDFCKEVDIRCGGSRATRDEQLMNEIVRQE